MIRSIAAIRLALGALLALLITIDVRADPAKVLDVTPDQFAARFNKEMSDIKLPYRVKANVSPGSKADAFKATLTDNIALVGAVDKQQKMVIDVTLLGGGDGSAESGKIFLGMALFMFIAASPNIERDAIIGEFQKLVRAAMADPKGASSRVINGLKMETSRSPTFGTMFVASSVD